MKMTSPTILSAFLAMSTYGMSTEARNLRSTSSVVLKQAPTLQGAVPASNMDNGYSVRKDGSPSVDPIALFNILSLDKQ